MPYLKHHGFSEERPLIQALLFLTLLVLIYPSNAVSNESTHLSHTEINTISRFGPWPLTSDKDKTNKYSENALAQTLGKTLFFDSNLSAKKGVSCASCHQPNHAFTDQIPVAIGLKLGSRNTPSLLNVRFKHWYGWGGDIDTLWGASLRAIINPKEMGANTTDLVTYLEKSPSYQSLTELADWKNTSTEQGKLVLVGKMLAAYQEQLISPPSAFDQFRQALLNKNTTQMAKYGQAEIRGLKLFIGKGNCHFCHMGPNFSNGEFGDIGMPYFDHQGKIDKGRYAGIKNIKSSPFSSLGRYNDDNTGESKVLAQHLVLKHRNFGEFMVPPLRNIKATAPYMHQGSLRNLAQVIEHYSELDEERLHSDGVAIVKPLKLSSKEKSDLKAFLESL